MPEDAVRSRVRYLLAGLVLLSLAHAQDSSVADRAAVAFFKRVSALPRAVVLRRIQVDNQWDLVVALASGTACEIAPRLCWWSTKDRLGVLIQDRNDPGKVQALAVEPGPHDDCSARIERFTAQELVLSCTGEKWSTYDNQKFVYDVSARKLVSHFSYPPFSTERVLHGPQFVMTDKQRQLLVDIDPVTGEPRMVSAKVPEPPHDSDAGFGPGGRFHVSKEGSVVEGAKVYRLPQTDVKTWQLARPDDARSYLHLDQAEINEQIGPHQLVGGTLWFGKTFYNGEGATGLGGFGYFDPATASYHLIAPPPIYAWSVSAILVEADAVWLALYRRGEYGNSPGGLLRWDRKAARARRWEMPWIAVSIARAGEAIYLGATDGIVALRGERISSYFVDRSAAGRYQLTAR